MRSDNPHRHIRMVGYQSAREIPFRVRTAKWPFLGFCKMRVYPPYRIYGHAFWSTRWGCMLERRTFPSGIAARCFVLIGVPGTLQILEPRQGRELPSGHTENSVYSGKLDTPRHIRVLGRCGSGGTMRAVSAYIASQIAGTMCSETVSRRWRISAICVFCSNGVPGRPVQTNHARPERVRWRKSVYKTTLPGSAHGLVQASTAELGGSIPLGWA